MKHSLNYYRNTFIALFLLAMIVGFVGTWFDWNLDLYMGMILFGSFLNGEIWVAGKRWFPSHTKWTLVERQAAIDAIKSTEPTSTTPIYDEMGGKP